MALHSIFASKADRISSSVFKVKVGVSLHDDSLALRRELVDQLTVHVDREGGRGGERERDRQAGPEPEVRLAFTERRQRRKRPGPSTVPPSAPCETTALAAGFRVNTNVVPVCTTS